MNNEARNVHKVNKAEPQGRTLFVPGPGQYKTTSKLMPNEQRFTSNMMSKTKRELQGQPLHAANYPSATHYDTRDYDTIENPMVTGGSPSNILALSKYESMKRNKASNPFKTEEKSHDNVLKLSNFDKNTMLETA